MDVPSKELEDALRELLSQRADLPRPVTADPAGVAIRRANRIQRRRTLTGMGLAVATVMAVSAVGLQLRDDRPPTGGTVVISDPDQPLLVERPIPPPEPATTTPIAEVDLLIDGSIATAQGRRVPLLGTGEVERAHRLTDGRGWLAVGVPTLAGRSLWAVAGDGAAQALLAGADEIVLDPQGRQVAWKQGTVLAAAKIVNGELDTVVRAEAPAEAVPVRFVGDAVLVRLAPDRPGHVLWPPRPGTLGPGGDRASTHIFGALPDGRLVATVIPGTGTGTGTCLTLLDPARDLAPATPECGPQLPGDGPGAVSPDGRWLLVNGPSAGEESALLVDLAKLDASGVRPAGPAMTGTVVWSTPDTAHYADADGRLVRVAVDQVTEGRRAAPTALPGLPDGASPVVVSGG